MRKLVAICISGAMALSSAAARDWPDAGGWSIGEASDSCGMTQVYEGKGATDLTILVYLDGNVGLMVTNADWSPTDGQKYEMDYLLNNTSYGGGAAVGVASGYKKGFVAKFGGDFARDFAAGSSLRIYRGDVLVDQLSLDGTAAGMAMVRRCLAHLQSVKDAEDREKRRYAHIADDPFAVKRTDAEVSQFGIEPARPRGSVGGWISDADYPSRAQREERSGTVGYKLEVGADGRVSSCVVTASSGHPDLDEATCRLLPRRARFSSGGVYENVLTWRLPK